MICPYGLTLGIAWSKLKSRLSPNMSVKALLSFACARYAFREAQNIFQKFRITYPERFDVRAAHCKHNLRSLFRVSLALKLCCQNILWTAKFNFEGHIWESHNFYPAGSSLIAWTPVKGNQASPSAKTSAYCAGSLLQNACRFVKLTKGNVLESGPRAGTGESQRLIVAHVIFCMPSVRPCGQHAQAGCAWLSAARCCGQRATRERRGLAVLCDTTPICVQAGRRGCVGSEHLCAEIAFELSRSNVPVCAFRFMLQSRATHTVLASSQGYEQSAIFEWRGLGALCNCSQTSLLNYAVAMYLSGPLGLCSDRAWRMPSWRAAARCEHSPRLACRYREPSYFVSLCVWQLHAAFLMWSVVVREGNVGELIFTKQ